MSMKYGWFGNQEVPSSSDISEKIANTAMTCYMPFKLRSAASFAAYKKEADKFLNKVGDTGVKVLLEIPAAALGNGAFVTSINNAYGNHSKVEGFYLEEPDEFGYSPHHVQDLNLSLSKDLVINLKMRSNQAVYNTWGSKCDVLAAPDYVLLDDTDPWEGIENMSALAKLKNAKPSSFWHVMQAWQREDLPEEFPPYREPTEPDGKYYEMWWLAHRPFIDKAKGMLFFSWPRASDGLHTKVKDMCLRIKQESFNRAFENHADDHTDSGHVQNLGHSDILFRYQYFSLDWWLLVVDKNPDTAAAGAYPKQVKFKCNLGDRSGTFIVLNNRYADYFTENNTEPGRIVPVTRNGSWATFNEEGSSFGLQRGEVRLYRFLCGG